MTPNGLSGKEWRGGIALSTVCDDLGDSGVWRGLEPGTYQVTVEATIEGTEHVMPTNTVEVSLRCGLFNCSSAGEPSIGPAVAILLIMLRRAERSRRA